MADQEILIANHDRRAAHNLASALTRTGYRVSLAYSSDEAIQAAKRGLVLLVIDPIMPGLSGLEAAKHIFAATGCKVLFWTDLAGDEDFEALLSGLVRDGIDCSAFTTKRSSADLIAYVQASISLKDSATATENDLATSPSPSSPPSSEPPSGANEAPRPGHAQPSLHAPLFAVANSQLYQLNAFRLTGLKVTARTREIKRAHQEFGMSRSLRRAWKPKCLIATVVEPSDDEVETAFSLIMDPEQRLLQDFFWFWPDGVADRAFASLEACDPARALAEWGRQSAGNDPRGIATHNLAVFSHLQALKVESSSPSASKLWSDAFRNWKAVVTNSRFWDHYIQRIREMNDPRLTPELAHSIWTTLPEALLYINAQSAVMAGEKGEYAEATRQKQLMYSSGLGTDNADKAIYRALTPLLEHLTLICQQATSKVNTVPEEGAQVVEELRTARAALLRTLNCLVGVEDQRRNEAHDEVASTIRGCLIAYVNKTDGWSVAFPLFEDCMAIAHGKELQAKLAEDIAIVERHLPAASAKDCPAASAQVPSQPSSPSGNRQTKAPQARPAAVRRGYALGRAWRKLPRRSKVAVGMVAAILVAMTLLLSADNASDVSGRSPASGSIADSNPVATSATQPAAKGDLLDQALASVAAERQAKGAKDNSLGFVPDNKARSGKAPPDTLPPNFNGWDKPPAKGDIFDQVWQEDITSLRKDIAQAKIQLTSQEADMRTLNSEIDDYKSKIDADRAILDRMESDNSASIEIERDEYERVRIRHNQNVRDLNADISRGHDLHSQYEVLLAETNTKIDKFNEMVRKQ